MGSRTLLVLSLALVAVERADTRDAPQPPSIGCADDADHAAAGDGDLYCIELLPAGEIAGPSGTARLLPPSSPFGLAVSPSGETVYDVPMVATCTWVRPSPRPPGGQGPPAWPRLKGQVTFAFMMLYLVQIWFSHCGSS